MLALYPTLWEQELRVPHQQEGWQGSPCVVGEVVSPLHGSRVLSAPGRCGVDMAAGVGMAAEVGTATGCPCPVVLTLPCCHYRPSACTPQLVPGGDRDQGHRDIWVLLGYKGYKLERE